MIKYKYQEDLKSPLEYYPIHTSRILCVTQLLQKMADYGVEYSKQKETKLLFQVKETFYNHSISKVYVY